MRPGIVVEVTAADRDRLDAIVADRNSPQKHVRRAAIVLATAEGLGTAAIMRQARARPPSVYFLLAIAEQKAHGACIARHSKAVGSGD
jgi:hypothetical protein